MDIGEILSLLMRRLEMKAKVVYIERSKADKINRILEAGRDFMDYGKKKKM